MNEFGTFAFVVDFRKLSSLNVELFCCSLPSCCLEITNAKVIHTNLTTIFSLSLNICVSECLSSSGI
jgi:hypothetical protein